MRQTEIRIMPSWLLLLLLFVAWCLVLLAAAAGRAADDSEQGVSDSARGGVSIFPGIPLCPLAAWGVALLLDQYVSPWGTTVVGGSHVLLAVGCVISIIRNVNRARNSESRI
jgi:hypothetical protein